MCEPQSTLFEDKPGACTKNHCSMFCAEDPGSSVTNTAAGFPHLDVFNDLKTTMGVKVLESI